MSGQQPQNWQYPNPHQTDPYGVPQPVQPTDPYGQQWSAAPQPPQYPAPGYAAAPSATVSRPMNTLALVGFILSLVGIPIAPIIMGTMARKQIRETGESGDGLALAAIIIGWVAVGVVGLMIVFWVLWMFFMFGAFGLAFAGSGLAS